MAQPKHTPGQWRAEAWINHAVTTVLIDDPALVTGKRVIADCETEEDARLIAAAPQLLEIARAYVRFFEGGRILPGSPVDKARALIAKVEGQQ